MNCRSLLEHEFWFLSGSTGWHQTRSQQPGASELVRLEPGSGPPKPLFWQYVFVIRVSLRLDSCSMTVSLTPHIVVVMSYSPVPFRKQFPLEVQEAIIDQLRHEIWPLRSCALTCHAWHVRSRFHIFREIHIRGYKRLKDLCAYLSSHPVLQPLVQSIVVDSDSVTMFDEPPAIPVSDLICTPLLNQLPALRRCELRHNPLTNSPRSRHQNVLHASTLLYLQTHSCIESLCLSRLQFVSPTPLIKLITALPRLVHLECDRISLSDTTRPARPVNMGPAYRRKTTKLRSLMVSVGTVGRMSVQKS